MKLNHHNLYLILLTCTFLVNGLNASAQEDLEKELSMPTNKQEKVMATFKSTKLINGHTNETLHKNELDFKVDHRFGDIAGRNGGIKQFFGLDNSTDVKIGFEYGLSDRLTLGLARAKGTTAVQQLYEGSFKYRLLQQALDDHIPFGITIFGSNTIAGVASNTDDPSASNSYRNFSERMNWVAQAIIARKFSSNFSLMISPTYVHRNLTVFRDQNEMFAIGAGGRYKFTKRMALVIDYFIPFRNQTDQNYLEEQSATKFYNTLGLGLEMETGGHVFHLNFTNATALQEMQFIPQTTTSWLKGQYRWGFSIARRFTFGQERKKKTSAD